MYQRRPDNFSCGWQCVHIKTAGLNTQMLGSFVLIAKPDLRQFGLTFRCENKSMQFHQVSIINDTCSHWRKNIYILHRRRWQTKYCALHSREWILKAFEYNEMQLMGAAQRRPRQTSVVYARTCMSADNWAHFCYFFVAKALNKGVNYKFMFIHSLHFFR